MVVSQSQVSAAARQRLRLSDQLALAAAIEERVEYAEGNVAARAHGEKTMTQRHCDLCSQLYAEETLDLGADELGFCNSCARDRQVECEDLEREAADEKDSEIDRVSRLVELELTTPVGAKR